MSTSPTDSPIQLASGMHIVSGNPESILAKRRDFPGTAALVEELKPYYDEAVRSLSPTGGNGKSHANAVTLGRLPEALAKEVRQHLSELQTGAIHAKTQGATTLASEILDVAADLTGMLSIAQQLGKESRVPAAARKMGNGA
ncbi:MAG: hypothetical protein K2Q01_09565 [Rickettsiales bacterium]|nr:hypothetical protein [Rickettsiales bacterium]